MLRKKLYIFAQEKRRFSRKALFSEMLTVKYKPYNRKNNNFSDYIFFARKPSENFILTNLFKKTTWYRIRMFYQFDKANS